MHLWAHVQYLKAIPWKLRLWYIINTTVDNSLIHRIQKIKRQKFQNLLAKVWAWTGKLVSSLLGDVEEAEKRIISANQQSAHENEMIH